MGANDGITAVRYVQQPCDTRKWYLASTTTAVHEQQQCLNCYCVIFLCTARPRQAETNYHLCNTSTCCPNFSRPRPPCGYLAAARQAMCNPDECTPWCMSSLPYLTAAQQKLLLQNFHALSQASISVWSVRSCVHECTC